MRLFLLSVLTLGLLGSGAAQAEEPAESLMTVSNAYSYATSATQKAGVVFMEIENPGEAADKVTGAQADVSETVELHTHTMEDGVMKMREVEDGYELAAGETTILNPMGHHIMLINLNAPLREGESFPLTLNFEHHAPITIDVPVLAPGAKP